jgi:hypothetical protein
MKKLALLTLLLMLSISLAYAANWQTVTVYSGASDKTTDYFKIDASEWRLTWTYTPKTGIAGDLAVFSIFIYPKGETKNYVDFILKSGRNETSNSLYVHQGGGEFYLKIGAANIDGYSVTVEQDADSIPKLGDGNNFLSGAIVAVVIIAVAIAVVMLVKRRKKTS